jgi:predicted dehydrogenase
MIWLIGAGPMAIEYAKVLEAQNRLFICITRSVASAKRFEESTSIQAVSGGIEVFLLGEPECANQAIIVTGVEHLSTSTNLLLEYGVKSILVEKPASLYLQQVQRTLGLAKHNNAQVYVAYNRRFYASVIAAKKMIDEDGGVTSLNYEITEWAHVIDKLDKPVEVKENWFLANTTHVVDLAFYIGGRPAQLSAFVSGGTAWHSRSASFAGAGLTESQALFSYSGNWNAPGRWSVEVLTGKRRFILRPLEKLQVQMIGSVNIESVEVDDIFDQKFKPGIYLQTKAFLDDSGANLLSLREHAENMQLYNKMAGYQ